MRANNREEQHYLKAQKRVKDIRGFYTHLAATVFVLPFLIFINFTLVPQYHWFWFAIVGWGIGLFFHWLNVFGLTGFSYREDWERKKIKELMGDHYLPEMAKDSSNYVDEHYYMNAKKKMKNIKGFYSFLVICIFTIPLIIYVNLTFVPGFYFFWFAVVGMLFALFMMWLDIYGFDKVGLGKKWERRKIEEIMKEYKGE